MKKVIFCLIFLFIFLFVNFSYAASLTLEWDKNTEIDLAGYRLYQSEQSGVYNIGDSNSYKTIIAPASEYTFQNINAAVEQFFVVTAYDIEENESGPSNEVSYITDSIPPAVPGGLKRRITITIE